MSSEPGISGVTRCGEWVKITSFGGVGIHVEDILASNEVGGEGAQLLWNVHPMYLGHRGEARWVFAAGLGIFAPVLRYADWLLLASPKRIAIDLHLQEMLLKRD